MNTLENLGIVIIEIDNINNKFNDFDGASEIIDGIPLLYYLKILQMELDKDLPLHMN